MIAKEVGIIAENEYDKLSSLSYQIGLMLRKLIQYLTQSNYKGQKFNSSVEESTSDYKMKELTPDILNEITSVL